MQPQHEVPLTVLWRRVAMVGLLLLSMGVPTYFNASISLLAPFLVADLSLSRTQLGSLATIAYATATATAATSGRIADRIAMRTSLLVLIGGATVSILLLAFSTTFAIAAAAALVAGLWEASNTPVTNRLVADAFHRDRQGLAIGVKQSGVKLSQLSAGALLPPMALAFGWRPSLGVGVVAGLIGMALTIVLIDHESPTYYSPRERLRRRVDRRMWALSGYAGLMAMAQAPMQVYLPLFAVESVGMGVQAAGLTIAVSSGVAIAARIAWGAFAARLQVLSGTLMLLALGSAGSVVAIALSERYGPTLVWIGAVGFGLTAAVWSTLIYLTVTRDTHADETGWASGIVHMAFLAGFGASPVIFGAVVDHIGGYGIAWAGSIILFVAAAALGRFFFGKAYTLDS